MDDRTTERSLPGVGGIVPALNREWVELDRQQGEIVAGWAVHHPVFANCRGLSEILDVVRADPDGGLYALLSEVATGDERAGRVVLQSMIGRLVQMARRDAQAGVDDYLAAMWCEIRTYPIARRPVRIAANLALDTLKAVRREHRWVVRGEVTTWPPGEFLDEIFHSAGAVCSGAGRTDDLDARNVLAAARHLNVIDAPVHELLASVYLDGLSGVEAARRHRSTAGSVRVRCSRAVGRLARAAPDLLEAA